MENFKTNITNHLTNLYNLYSEELNKSKKQLEENPRAQWCKMEVLRYETAMNTYKIILTNIKIGSYDDENIPDGLKQLHQLGENFHKK